MLEKLALTDPLTGLPNRRAIDRLVESEIRRRARYPSPLALGLLDADHFKEINSRFLLPGGDQVLIELGRTVSACLRAVDTVARVGGEEFQVVAPETTFEGATALGERIRAGVEQSTYYYNGSSIQATVSIGFAVAEAGTLPDYDQFKHVAAEALAEAKAAGRNRCIVRALAKSP
jgi:diguanylate cyclase (GGDEF)-like protein